MAALLAQGTTIVGSADFTLAAGDTATLVMTEGDASGQLPANAELLVQYKSAALNYTNIGRLTNLEPSRVLSSPGTYRVFRNLAVNVGCDKN